MVIDCNEVFIERPSNLTARAQTSSNQKLNNTAKYLIGSTSSVAVKFLSADWGGRVSDKQISTDSHFFDKISMGDCVLEDRGFTFKEDFASLGAILKVPHFTKGKR